MTETVPAAMPSRSVNFLSATGISLGPRTVLETPAWAASLPN
jgi:hypothetical protein